MQLIRSLPPTGAALTLLLLAGPAFAAPTATLTVSPTKPSGAATTCLTVTVTARDAAGATPTDTPTVTVTLSATGTATTSFCDPATGESLGPAATTTSRDVATSRSTADGPQTAKVGVTSESTGPVSVVASYQQVQSATATATFSDPPPPACAAPPSLSVSPSIVVAGQRSTATITGSPGTEVQLYAYSRPGSTRLYAVQRYCSEPSPSLVELVNRTAVGTGGRWSLDRAFLRPARLTLYARTRTTLARLAGTSPVRPTVIA